jgi:phosphoglycolate phosphatase-like HAD superfamily hydrolase
MNMAASVRLILFDIDGTLLSSGPPAREAFASALHTVFGTAGDIHNYRFEGRLDPVIISELIQGAGVLAPVVEEKLPSALTLYLDNLETALSLTSPRLKPGVREILDDLAERADVVKALLTGNVERGARIKLTAAGLWNYFLFGAWGDEGKTRSELGPVALKRAFERTGRTFSGRESVVVGDSRHDVECGKAIGARVVAVATGLTPANLLADAGADVVLQDLSDLEAVRHAILG